ncbi:MAG: flagellar export protein FliJ [Trichlorobacter sp.]|uniref:flagellar export protein FliJ n=1 Tax=Trichlorobacter sp. TaxID=2911007 RepID=UPI002562A723|nr:flagellar export protein FliJ [Trichlorobacter sp.]MDK9717991.1 flagellar export protein FliJ [Trichlorobacter sp.]
MAVKKKFEMQQVLNYRVELEKMRKQEFAAARHDLDAASDRLEQEKSEAAKLAEEFSGRQQQIDSIFEMRLYADFFARKRDEIKEQQRRVESLDHVLEDRRDELVQATKEKKVMEQFKQKQKEAFLKEQAHKEGLLLDEIATQKKGQE